MIANPERTTIVSSAGWVDHDALWCFDVDSGKTETIALGTGDPSAWTDVPLLYVEYLGFAPWKDFVLLKVSPMTGKMEVQRLEWYDDSYDKGYQGVIGVLQLPDDGSALVSVQRSSRLILHDLETGRQRRQFISVSVVGIQGSNSEIRGRDSSPIVRRRKNRLRAIGHGAPLSSPRSEGRG
jgi:hypothetical protein